MPLLSKSMLNMRTTLLIHPVEEKDGGQDAADEAAPLNEDQDIATESVALVAQHIARDFTADRLLEHHEELFSGIISAAQVMASNLFHQVARGWRMWTKEFNTSAFKGIVSAFLQAAGVIWVFRRVWIIKRFYYLVKPKPRELWKDRIFIICFQVALILVSFIYFNFIRNDLFQVDGAISAAGSVSVFDYKSQFFSGRDGDIDCTDRGHGDRDTRHCVDSVEETKSNDQEGDGLWKMCDLVFSLLLPKSISKVMKIVGFNVAAVFIVWVGKAWIRRQSRVNEMRVPTSSSATATEDTTTSWKTVLPKTLFIVFAIGLPIVVVVTISAIVIHKRYLLKQKVQEMSFY